MAGLPVSLDLTHLKLQLATAEGIRTTPYVDTTGHITIGVGHNLTAHPIGVELIEEWLDQDIQEAIQGLDAHLPWWRTLSAIRQEALVEMAFNLGNSRLLGFTKMLSALKDHKWAIAAKEALDSTWATQVGHRATRIAHMIETDTCFDGSALA